jgi:hypothetical protein
MKKLLFLALAISSASFAEVKPKGYVHRIICGDINRSVKLCTASSQDSKRKYLVLSHFSNPQPIYILADFKNLTPEGLVGRSITQYTGYLVSKDKNGYDVEQKYELTIEVAVTAQRRYYVSLKINGNKVPSLLEMTSYIETESVL